MAIRIFVSRKQARRVQTPNASIVVIWRRYLLPALTNAKLSHWRYLASISTPSVHKRQTVLLALFDVNIYSTVRIKRTRITITITNLPPTESIHLKKKNKISFNHETWLTKEKKSKKVKIQKVTKKNVKLRSPN